MFSPRITTSLVTDGSVKAAKNFKALETLAVYVGIPESTAARKDPNISNAQLVFILSRGVRTVDVRRRMGAMMLNRNIGYEAAKQLFERSHGSIAMAIPPRPLVEPAIEAPDNKVAITDELGDAAKKQLGGDRAGAIQGMKRAGMTAQNKVRGWFDDPRNGWAPNAPSTIRRKGSSHPMIATGAMKAAITYVLGETK